MKRRKVPANKGKKFPPEVLTTEEMDRLLKAPSKRAPTGIRNRALLYVGYRGGLRLAEALALYPKDVDTKQGIVHVLLGKGKKSRTIGLPQDACMAIDRWMDKRKKLRLTGRRPLFCTLAGKPLKKSYVRALMKRLGQKAGIEKRVHYHGLRHTCAYNLSEMKHVSHVLIQKALGHSSLQTTDRYLSHVAPIAVVEAMRNQ